MKKICAFFMACVLVFSLGLVGCGYEKDSDRKQQIEQESILTEIAKAVGMPNIVNFREKRILKDIYELRDQEGLRTFTYTYNHMTGKFHFLCHSIGYGIPYATQYTSPAKVVWPHGNGHVVPQADPNGLFSPPSAEATWVMAVNPKTNKASVIYIEERILVSQFPLPNAIGNPVE